MSQKMKNIAQAEVLTLKEQISYQEGQVVSKTLAQNPAVSITLLLAQIADPSGLPEAAKWNGSGNWEEKAGTVGVLSTENEDIRSLRELITYGLKGLSAYSKHANVLLKDDEEVDAFLQRALAATLDDNLSVEELIALTMETGKHGVSGMALLDKANTEAYGNPEITKVNIGVGTNPGILVSGHDLCKSIHHPQQRVLEAEALQNPGDYFSYFVNH